MSMLESVHPVHPVQQDYHQCCVCGKCLRKHQALLSGILSNGKHFEPYHGPPPMPASSSPHMTATAPSPPPMTASTLRGYHEEIPIRLTQKVVEDVGMQNNRPMRCMCKCKLANCISDQINPIRRPPGDTIMTKTFTMNSNKNVSLYTNAAVSDKHRDSGIQYLPPMEHVDYKPLIGPVQPKRSMVPTENLNRHPNHIVGPWQQTKHLIETSRCVTNKRSYTIQSKDNDEGIDQEVMAAPTREDKEVSASEHPSNRNNLTRRPSAKHRDQFQNFSQFRKEVHKSMSVCQCNLDKNFDCRSNGTRNNNIKIYKEQNLQTRPYTPDDSCSESDLRKRRSMDKYTATKVSKKRYLFFTRN